MDINKRELGNHNRNVITSHYSASFTYENIVNKLQYIIEKFDSLHKRLEFRWPFDVQ